MPKIDVPFPISFPIEQDPFLKTQIAYISNGVVLEQSSEDPLSDYVSTSDHDDDYGVLVGQFVKIEAESEFNFGAWYHVHLTVEDDRSNKWNCAVDIGKPMTATVAYVFKELTDSVAIQQLDSLEAGWHPLPNGQMQGLRYEQGWLADAAQETWTRCTGVQIADEMIKRLKDPKENKKIFVFGMKSEAKGNGKVGLHNVHMNHGSLSYEFPNYVDQDGVVIIRHEATDSSPVVWWRLLFKFTNQVFDPPSGQPEPPQNVQNKGLRLAVIGLAAINNEAAQQKCQQVRKKLKEFRGVSLIPSDVGSDIHMLTDDATKNALIGLLTPQEAVDGIVVTLCDELNPDLLRCLTDFARDLPVHLQGRVERNMLKNIQRDVKKLIQDRQLPSREEAGKLERVERELPANLRRDVDRIMLHFTPSDRPAASLQVAQQVANIFALKNHKYWVVFGEIASQRNPVRAFIKGIREGQVTRHFSEGKAKSFMQLAREARNTPLLDFACKVAKGISNAGDNWVFKAKIMMLDGESNSLLLRCDNPEDFGTYTGQVLLLGAMNDSYNDVKFQSQSGFLIQDHPPRPDGLRTVLLPIVTERPSDSTAYKFVSDLLRNGYPEQLIVAYAPLPEDELLQTLCGVNVIWELIGNAVSLYEPPDEPNP